MSSNVALKPLGQEKKRILPDNFPDTSKPDTKASTDPDKTHLDPDSTQPECVTFRDYAREKYDDLFEELEFRSQRAAMMHFHEANQYSRKCYYMEVTASLLGAVSVSGVGACLLQWNSGGEAGVMSSRLGLFGLLGVVVSAVIEIAGKGSTSLIPTLNKRLVAHKKAAVGWQRLTRLTSRCHLKMPLSTVNNLLFFLMIITTLQHPRGVSALQELLLREDPALTDMVFTKPPLFLSNTSPYLPDCAALCLTYPDCVTLTFNSGPPPPLCQGHDKLMTSHSPGLLAKGTRTFIFGNVSTWVEKPCVLNGVDCTVTNSECFMGRCLCTPGYYYSHSQDACVPTCATADLQYGYMMYPGSGIWAYNFKTTKFVTLNQCKLLCFADTRCRDLDFDYNTDTCYLHSVTTLNVTAGYWRTFTTLDFYQRTCA